jgi:hypothetical protein
MRQAKEMLIWEGLLGGNAKTMTEDIANNKIVRRQYKPG